MSEETLRLLIPVVSSLVGTLVGGFITWQATRTTDRRSRLRMVRSAARVMTGEFGRIQPLVSDVEGAAHIARRADQYRDQLRAMLVVWAEVRMSLTDDIGLEAFALVTDAITSLEELGRFRMSEEKSEKVIAGRDRDRGEVVAKIIVALEALATVSTRASELENPWWTRARTWICHQLDLGT